jgi:hypothetical protein
MYVVYVDYIKTTNDKIIFEPDTGGTCHNPSYPGGRDTDDHGSNPA